jgi:hypothetical protein
MVDAVLLRALPFPEPGQLVRIVDKAPGINVRDKGMSVPELADLENRSGIFQSVSGYLAHQWQHHRRRAARARRSTRNSRFRAINAIPTSTVNCKTIARAL